LLDVKAKVYEIDTAMQASYIWLWSLYFNSRRLYFRDTIVIPLDAGKFYNSYPGVDKWNQQVGTDGTVEV
jgi:hypothetical protein